MNFETRTTTRVTGAILRQNEDMPLLITMTGGGISAQVPHDVKLWWALKSETEFGLYHGDKKVSRLTTYNDHYGYLSSFLYGADECIKDTKHRYSIDDNSTLEIRADMTLTASPYGERAADKEHNIKALQEGNNLVLVSAARNDIRVPCDINAETAASLQYPIKDRALESIEMASFMVYSSFRSKAENDAAKEELQRVWGRSEDAPRYAKEAIIARFDDALRRFTRAEDLIAEQRKYHTT